MPPKAAAVLRATSEIRAAIADCLKDCDAEARKQAAAKVLQMLRVQANVVSQDQGDLSTEDLLKEAGVLLCDQDRSKTMKDIVTLLRGLAPDFVEQSQQRASSPRPQRPTAVQGVKSLAAAAAAGSDTDEPPKPKRSFLAAKDVEN